MQRKSNRFRASHSTSALLSVLLVMAGCGHWPPVVDTAADVRHLAASEKSVRARGLRDDDIPSLARLHDLDYIDFGGGVSVQKAKITDKGLERLAKLDLPHLATLSLQWCNNITDDGVTHVCRTQTIKTLLLTACPKITDDAMSALATAKNLTYLDLRACPGITDRGLETLSTNANWDVWIVLDGAPNVTAQGVAKLRAALPNARIGKDDRKWEYQAARTKVK